jgi:hypothetical protein
MEPVPSVRTIALSVVFAHAIPHARTTVFKLRLIPGLAAFGHGTPIRW